MSAQTHPFRTLFHAVACLAMAAGSAVSNAQPIYPSKPVRIIIPAPAGGSIDATGRMLAAQLEKKWHQSIVLDNRAGGGTLVGMQALLSAPRDGHTLLLNVVSLSGVMPLLHGSRYDHNTQAIPVAMLTEYPLAVITGADSQIRTWKDFADMASAVQGATSYGTTGIAGAAHQLGELIKNSTNLRLQDVPYKGDSQMIPDVVGGQIPLGLTVLGSSLPMVRSGRLTALAVSSEQRMPFAPDIPTLKEQGVDAVLTSWNAVYTTLDVDPAIVEQLNRDINEAVQSPEMQEYIRRNALISNPMSVAEFQAKAKADSEAYVARARALDLQPTK